MTRRDWFVLTAAVAYSTPSPGKEKEIGWLSTKTNDFEIHVLLIRDTAEIERLLGSDLDKEFTLAEIKIQPLYGAKLTFDRGDFVLRSFSGNETSTAQSPSRIAGAGVLALGVRQTSATKVYSQDSDAVILGNPGGGRPGRLGAGDNTFGGGKTSEGQLTVEQKTADESTLLGRLEAREMPLSGEDKPFGGYLFFQLNPKHKLKHLSLAYDGRHGEFRLSFKD